MFAVAIWDARAPAARARPRPLRDQAALLPRRRRRARVRLRARRAAAAASSTSTRSRRSSPSTRSRRRSRSSARSASCRPATCSTWRGRARRLERFARPGPAAAARTTTTRPSSSRSAARGCATRCARTSSPTCPVGVLLSGGVDSGALAALAARGERRSRCGRSRSASRRRRSTSSPARARSPSATARSHRELVLRPDAALLLPALADAFDEPFADSSALPTYLVSKLAAEDVKVALSGEGGDELFGGYYTYVADLLAERVGPLARARAAARRAAADVDARRRASTTRRSASSRAAHLPPLERHHGWKEIFSRRRARRADRPRAHACDPVAAAIARASPRPRAHELLTRLQDVDLGIYLVDDLLVKTDRASMAWSLEARVPFLDTGRRRTSRSRCRRGTRCAASRRSGCCGRPSSRCCRARSCTGASAASRSPPPPGCAASSSRSRARRSPPRRCAARASSSPQRSSALLDDHVAGRADLSRQLWGLLAFTLWYERHVEGDPPRRAARAGRSPDEGLDRHDGERAPARLPAAGRAAARRAATRSRSRRATTPRRCS